jgi:energy-coupling factor transport system ATP-binding protein
MSDLLRLEDVSFAYAGRAALEHVSFAMAPGERVALLGRNGAGKSTLLRLVTGLLKPAAGVVRVGDWDTRLTEPARLARRVGSLFQHADQQLFARTVRDDIGFGPQATGQPKNETGVRVERALSALGLESVADQHPYDLPPPLRKLAALAGALALEPALLVLDEPTAGLDRQAKQRVAEALSGRADRGVGLLVITHDLGFAAEILGRVLILERGRLALDAPLANVLLDAVRLTEFGLVGPPLARLSVAMALPGRPVRAQDVARALAKRCRT